MFLFKIMMLPRTLISCLLLLFATISFGQSINYEKHTDSLSRIGEQAKIIPYLEQELKTNPNHERLLRMLGFYYVQEKHLNVAEEYYRQALAINPECARCYMHIGRIYAMRNDLSSALENFNKGIGIDPKDGLIVFWRARLNEYQGNNDAALADWNKTIALQPSDLVSYLQRASLHFKMENLDSACLDYQTAQRLNAEQKLKDTLLTSQIETAIQHICNPEKPAYYYQRGIAFYNLKQYQKAINCYDQGLIKFPGHAMILNFKGNALLALKQYEKAISSYQLALKNKENILKEIKLNPGFSTNKQKQHPDSENDIKNEDQIFKSFIAEIHYHIAECQLATKNLKLALASIDQAINLAPDTKDFPKEMYFNLREQIIAKNRAEKI